MTDLNYPETVEAAVRLLKVEVSDSEQEKIRAMMIRGLLGLHLKRLQQPRAVVLIEPIRDEVALRLGRAT